MNMHFNLHVIKGISFPFTQFLCLKFTNFSLNHGVTWFRSFLLKQRYQVKPLFNMAIKSITERALHLMLCMGYFKSIFWSIYYLLTTPTLFSHVVSAPCLIRASITWACPFSVAQCKGVILSCIKKIRSMTNLLLVI